MCSKRLHESYFTWRLCLEFKPKQHAQTSFPPLPLLQLDLTGTEQFLVHTDATVASRASHVPCQSRPVPVTSRASHVSCQSRLVPVTSHVNHVPCQSRPVPITSVPVTSRTSQNIVCLERNWHE